MTHAHTARVNAIVERLSVEEKIAQLSCAGRAYEMDDLFGEEGVLDLEAFTHRFAHGVGQIGRMALDRDPSVARTNVEAIQRALADHAPLGIGALFNEEGIHGLMARGATVFPSALALAATWDVALVERTATATALEARWRGSNYVYGPVLDVARDPRWGRVEETFGEDPLLIGRLGAATVTGLQGPGERIDNEHVLACAKHFVGHGMPEAGANAGPLNIGPRALREIHVAPFVNAIGANVAAVMVGYHAIDGVPLHADGEMLSDLLRSELGFNGMVTSDGFGIPQLATLHRVAASEVDAAHQAFLAGVDCEVPQPVGTVGFADLVRSGAMDERIIDRALRNVLGAKERLGLLDSFDERPVPPLPSQELVATHDDLALHSARRAAVLLTNNGILPFSMREGARIAVVGPNAEHAHLGGYTDPGAQGVSVLRGLQSRFGHGSVQFSEGCRLTEEPSGAHTWWEDSIARSDQREDDALIQEAVELASRSDVTIAVVGGNESTHREGWWFDHLGDRNDLTMPGRQNELIERLSQTGTPLIVLALSAGPIDLCGAVDAADAVMWSCYPGQRGGDAIAQVLAGDHDPGGRLPVTFPRSTGQIPITNDRLPSAGRNYLNEPNQPLFDFGHGCSYTKFVVSLDSPEELSISVEELAAGSTVDISATVSNIGERAGIEHVRMSVDDERASVSRPRHRLADFVVVELAPGESRQITLRADERSLGLFNRRMQFVVEPGLFGLSLHWSRSNGQSAPSRTPRRDVELSVI